MGHGRGSSLGFSPFGGPSKGLASTTQLAMARRRARQPRLAPATRRMLAAASSYKLLTTQWPCHRTGGTRLARPDARTPTINASAPS
jgi:hypothetical protein